MLDLSARFKSTETYILQLLLKLNIIGKELFVMYCINYVL